MVEQRLRLFQLILAGFIFIGTPLELWLTEHFESPPQVIPFILCGLGLLAVMVVLWRPQRATLLALRGVMGLVFLGSLFGVFEHVEHNMAFELEIRPNAIPSDLIFEALRGVNPLLAPGILALAAIIAVVATYYHPALGKK